MITSRDTELKALEAEISDVCGILNVAYAELVTLTARAIETGVWRGAGIRSVEHWLTMRAGLAYRTARQVAALARRRAELPVTVQTLGEGRLTLDQAAAVAELAPAHTDERASSLATVTTVSQIRQTLSKYAFADPAPAPEEADGGGSVPDREPAVGAEAEARRKADRERAAGAKGSASMFFDGVRFGLHVDAPADVGALIQQAMKEAKDALFHAGHEDVGWLDALAEMANRSLSGVQSTTRRDKYRVYVHLDTAGGWLNAGPALPQSLLDKICCDGIIRPLWETEGRPVNVGRAQRIAPPHTRRVVEDRDRECRFPGCGARHYLEVHHIIPWRQGGRTDTPDLVALCPHHHDGHHCGEFSIQGNADHPAGLTFRDAEGHRIMVVHPPSPPGDAPPPRPPNGQSYRPPSGERLQRRWVHFPPAPPPPPPPSPSPSPPSPPSPPPPPSPSPPSPPPSPPSPPPPSPSPPSPPPPPSSSPSSSSPPSPSPDPEVPRGPTSPPGSGEPPPEPDPHQLESPPKPNAA